MRDPAATHEVFNQVPPLEGFNAFLHDRDQGEVDGGRFADHPKFLARRAR